jgi:hypothetical protein
VYTLLAVTIRPERVPRGRSRRRQDGLCARRARVRLSYRRCLQQGFAPFGASPLLPGINRYPSSNNWNDEEPCSPSWRLRIDGQRTGLVGCRTASTRGSNTRCGHSHKSSNDVQSLRPMPDKLNRGPPVFLIGGTLCSDRGIPDAGDYPALSRTANSIAWYWSSRALRSSSFSLM